MLPLAGLLKIRTCSQFIVKNRGIFINIYKKRKARVKEVASPSFFQCSWLEENIWVTWLADVWFFSHSDDKCRPTRSAKVPHGLQSMRGWSVQECDRRRTFKSRHKNTNPVTSCRLSWISASGQRHGAAVHFGEPYVNSFRHYRGLCRKGGQTTDTERHSRIALLASAGQYFPIHGSSPSNPPFDRDHPASLCSSIKYWLCDLYRNAPCSGPKWAFYRFAPNRLLVATLVINRGYEYLNYRLCE